jgi:hypothetical protein
LKTTLQTAERPKMGKLVLLWVDFLDDYDDVVGFEEHCCI